MRGSGTYLYPFRAQRGAEQAELADWPPLRRSGPEPGSDDMPPIVGPLGNYITTGPTPTGDFFPGVSVGTIAVGAMAIFAYLKWGRKK